MTSFRDLEAGVSDIFVTVAGYLTPPLVGLGSVALVLVLAAVGIGWSVFQGSPELQAGLAVALTWIMLIGAVTTLQGQGLGTPTSDAAALARASWIPAFLWVALFAFVAVVALWVGARRLLGV